MVFAWRSAGVSYVKYAEVCAQAVRNCLKEELKVAANKRGQSEIRFAKWENGKALESSNFLISSCFL